MPRHGKYATSSAGAWKVNFTVGKDHVMALDRFCCETGFSKRRVIESLIESGIPDEHWDDPANKRKGIKYRRKPPRQPTE